MEPGLVLIKNFFLTILATCLLIHSLIIQTIEKTHINYTLNELQVSINALERKLADCENLKKLE